MPPSPLLVILAGGASSRLWPLSDKSCLKFAGAPLLQRHLDTFARLGLDRAVIIANPTNQADIRALTDAWPAGRAEVVVQPDARGMGDALLQIDAYLERENDPPVYITQAHDVVDESLHRQVLEAYRQGEAASYLAGYQVPSYFPGGYLVVDASGRITGLIEKPGPGNEPSDLVNIVAHLHTRPRPLLEEIRQAYAGARTTDDHYEFAMSRQMAGVRYEVVRYDGPWNAIKYPWHVLDVMDYFLSRIEGQRISPEAHVAESALISGNVLIEAGARVFHGASVVGPAYIGAESIIGNGALVRESMVGAGCAVGHTSEVARSYLADGCQLHRAVVLDSVFDERVNFSAGCITANLRWDRGPVPSMVKGERMDTGRDKFGAVIGRDAFIGIQSGTMPGVKIGQRAVVGPFTNAMRDLPDNSLLYAVQQTHAKPLADSAGSRGMR
ncbi:MAG: sugar phosphate nucleotidyltransferase [Anaerolineae bacterium]